MTLPEQTVGRRSAASAWSETVLHVKDNCVKRHIRKAELSGARTCLKAY